MGQRQDRQVAAHERQVKAGDAADGAVVIAQWPEGRIGAGVKPGIDVERFVDVRRRQRPSVLERQAELENVGVRVERIGRGVDCFKAKWR